MGGNNNATSLAATPAGAADELQRMDIATLLSRPPLLSNGQTRAAQPHERRYNCEDDNDNGKPEQQGVAIAKAIASPLNPSHPETKPSKEFNPSRTRCYTKLHQT